MRIKSQYNLDVDILGLKREEEKLPERSYKTYLTCTIGSWESTQETGFWHGGWGWSHKT